MTKLVIVESPTKAKTLTKLLGKEYVIEASMGHVRDLPTKKLGVDVENNFAPEYEVADKSKKNINKLKKACKESDTVVLATDPDREGEAIAWHLRELLNDVKGNKNKRYERVVFHEITKQAVDEAFSHAGELNMDLVNAQQARRILDRLVGYKLSPLLWKKVRYGLSAGRVQSVAVRLVVERERERLAFVPVEYWSIEGLFETPRHDTFKAELFEKQNKKLEVTNETDAKDLEALLLQANYYIQAIKKTERVRKPYPPFKTSTLQQSAANIYGMPAKKTMSAAQKLFEKGLITYHRTDSLNLAMEFINSARETLKTRFGSAFIPTKPNFYKTSSKGAQEAHEAIRPTDLSVLPESKQKGGLTDDESKVYALIYNRSLECQTEAAIYDQTSVIIGSDTDYTFKANGSIIKFEGWLAIAKEFSDPEDSTGNVRLPHLEENEHLAIKKIDTEQHFTQPPARYSDASLIKTLEEMGIGRPSTYAPTISTIMARKYVAKEGRYFIPEDVAYVVTDLLINHINTVIDYGFTASMEENLDKIAEGTIDWVSVIKDFYVPFNQNVAVKDKELQKTDITNLGQSNEKCPDCSKPLNIKLGKYGKFLSCSGFPECEYAKPLEENRPLDSEGNVIDDFGTCDNCDDGKMLLKQGKFGKFLACSNYPKCKTTKPYLDKIGMICPTCSKGEVIVKKAKGRVFYGCSNYPECKYASWKNPNQGKEADSSDA